MLPPPQFVDPPKRSDATGTFVLAWSTRSKERYTLEESTSPDFAGAVPIHRGTADRFVIYGRAPGDYYYRVRAEVDGAVSNWSAGAGVRAERSTGWQLRSPDQYADDVVLATQRALLRMSAARGDLFAVVGLPEHYREAEAIAHVASLKAALRAGPAATRVPPLGRGEARAFSYGALYHPWIITREDGAAGALRRMPPDGAATGIMARRALTRGAWIAPANEPFRGVLALTPPLAPRRRLALQDAQINILRQEPRAFVALGADTLSDDPELLPINVRRLLILLRRLALREGATYVFEPNGEAFRRMVQRGFEALLGQMFVRGAFAGTAPATSFQVVAGSALNPPASIDRGRLIVELRVAPSLPLTFLTVRLVQTGDRRLIAQES